MNLATTEDFRSPDADWFSAVASQLAGVRDVGTAATVVIRASQSILEGADMVSLTIDKGSDTGRTTATDPAASELDMVQNRLRNGPRVAALQAPDLGLAYCPDLSRDAPWPAFAADAMTRGVGSVLSVALSPTIAPPRAGTLTFYSRTPDGLSEDVHPTAVLVAGHAGLVITMLSALERSERRAYHLSRALTSRDLIGQAKGIIMRSHGLSADKAFGLLSELSQRMNVKLHDLAAQVIENCDGIDPTAGLAPRRGRGLGSAN